jgi:hypothetical protein
MGSEHLGDVFNLVLFSMQKRPGLPNPFFISLKAAAKVVFFHYFEDKTKRWLVLPERVSLDKAKDKH